MTPEDLASIILNELKLRYHNDISGDVAYVDADQGLNSVVLDGCVDLIALSETILEVVR